MKIFAGALCLTVMASADAAAQPAAESGIPPFIAHYEASWKGISVGTSEIELTHGTEPGQYLYTWTITARGIFRIAYRDDLVQRSWLKMIGEHVRPRSTSAKKARRPWS